MSTPKGWKRVIFSDIAESITVRVDDPSQSGVDRYVGLEHLDPESLAITRWGSPTDVEATKLRFWPGDIIFGRRRAYQRKLAVADFEGICSAHALVLRAKPSVVLAEFLPFFMQGETFFNRALAISVGSLSPTINWKTLREQKFDLPPIDQQREIASLLSALESHRSTLTRIHVATTRTLSAIAVSSLEPITVPRVRFQDIATVERGISYKSDDYRPDGEGRPFLTLKAVTRQGTFSPSGLKWVRDDLAPGNVAEPGDLFFANTDLTPGRLLVGAPFFFPGLDSSYPPPCFSMDLSRVNAQEDSVDREYLSVALNLPRIRQQMRNLTGGSTVGHLRLAGVSDIEVPVLPHSEQEHFLGRIRDCQRAQRALKRAHDQSLSLRHRLLRHFMGDSSDVH